MSTNAPQSASTGNNPATIKERHYAQLAGRLAALNQNVFRLHQHVELALEHSLKTRGLAAQQASIFMAANSQELDLPNQEDPSSHGNAVDQ